MDRTEPGDASTTAEAIGGDALRSLEPTFFGDSGAIPVKASRFVILDRIGSGGMGSVFRAYDPKLNRRVALKVLKPGGGNRKTAQDRLEREAVGLAQLNHPNVVAVHEIGTAKGELFVAMEYVEGVDLRTWIHEHPVGSRGRFVRALKIMREAGKGLAAAHDAGLVHRDVKPSNVLVGEDGRARVADFGLVRDASEVEESDGAALDSSGLRSTLTQAGAVLGTPRFMSPEQQRGEPVDALSDQFSFCVTAWEVLLGAPPWRGVMPAPDVEPPLAPAGAPRWVVDTLARGLKEDPALRYASMDALLASLKKDPTRRRWVLGIAVGVVASAGLGVAAYLEHRASLCDDGPEALAAVWNPDVADTLRGRVGEGWAKAEPYLTAFAGAWRASFEEICDAGRRRGRMSSEQLRAALGCLAFERTELEAALDVLRMDEAIGRAPEVAAYPDARWRCAAARLSEALPDDPAQEREILDASRELVTISILAQLGRQELSAQRFAELETTLDAIEQPSLRLRATLARLRILVADSQFAEAQDVALPAYYAALEQRHDRGAMVLAVRLASFALDRAEVERALDWYERARVHAGHAHGRPTDFAHIEMLAAQIWLRSGDLEKAERHALEAVDLFTSTRGPDHPLTLGGLSTLATVKAGAGDFDAANVLFRRVYDGVIATFGPGAPQLGTPLHNLALVALRLRNYDESLHFAEAYLALQKEVRGDDHPDIASALTVYATVSGHVGRREDAVARMRDAAALFERYGTSDSAEALLNHSNIALSLLELGRYEDAKREADAAAQALAKAHGDDHRETGSAWLVVARAQIEQGKLANAERTLQKVRTSSEEWAETYLAFVAIKRGEFEKAVAMLEPFIAESKSSDALEYRARAFEGSGRHGAALADAAATMEQDPRPIRVGAMRALRSRVLLAMGRRSEALAEAEQGLSALEGRDAPVQKAALAAARTAAQAD